MIIRQTKTRYIAPPLLFPFPPIPDSAAVPAPASRFPFPVILSYLPWSIHPLPPHRESFHRSSFSQAARDRFALADESPGIPFPSSSTDGRERGETAGGMDSRYLFSISKIFPSRSSAPASSRAHHLLTLGFFYFKQSVRIERFSLVRAQFILHLYKSFF